MPDPQSDQVKPLRILLIAEAANPDWTSVPLEGWSHSRAIAQQVDAHIVTQIRNREAFLRAGLRESTSTGADRKVDGDFTAIDSEAIAKPIYKLANLIRGGKGKGWTTIQALSSLSYYYFEHLVWKRFGRRIRAGEFDVVHRLTPLSPTIPSFTLARMCAKHNVPFMLGPINGGVPWPKGFDSVRRAEREWLSYLRNAYRLMPGYRMTRKHAAAIVAGSIDTYEQIDVRWREPHARTASLRAARGDNPHSERGGTDRGSHSERGGTDRGSHSERGGTGSHSESGGTGKCFYIPENAIDPARFTARRTRSAAIPLRCVFVGRLVPYKGADMLLEAAAELLRARKITLTIIGDGPQREHLESIIAREKIADAVHLAGWVEHTKLQDRLIEHDLFTFPSIREFGGAVVLEAMAVGLVPVVVNYGGPRELITPATGFGIEIGSRTDVIARLRATLERIAADPARIDEMSQAARRRALAQFTWEAKARSIVEIYEWLAGRRATRPDNPMPLPDPEDSPRRHGEHGAAQEQGV